MRSGRTTALVARIHETIARDGPITFARFMDLALYDPDGGYYRAEAARPGRDGDFLTAPEAHPIFGAALARAVADAWDRLGRPDPFVLREYGAGTGTLALAVLDGLAAEHPDLAARLRYDPIEVEPRRLEAIAARLGDGRPRRRPRRRGRRSGRAGRRVRPRQRGPRRAPRPPSRRSGRRPARGPRRIARRSVRRRRGRTDHAGACVARLTEESVHLAEGQRAEICLGARSMAGRRRAAGLERGVLLLIDYGYPAAELYDPVRRRDGTLRAYLRHRVHDDPYIHVGRQDLTAHVDVTAVETAARAAGLDHLGTTTQAEFLVGLGTEDLLRAIQADPATTLEDYLAVRSALMRLLDPGAMGRFRVMAFGRGWPDGPGLAGLGYRLAR